MEWIILKQVITAPVCQGWWEGKRYKLENKKKKNKTKQKNLVGKEDVFPVVINIWSTLFMHIMNTEEGHVLVVSNSGKILP